MSTTPAARYGHVVQGGGATIEDSPISIVFQLPDIRRSWLQRLFRVPPLRITIQGDKCLIEEAPLRAT